jgi:hypothetical protein
MISGSEQRDSNPPRTGVPRAMLLLMLIDTGGARRQPAFYEKRA